MRTAQIITIAGVAAMAFGYWGSYTPAGRERFDEMAGMIPFFCLLIGAVGALIGALTLLYLRYRKSTGVRRAEERSDS
jgi:hypothetical protein